MNEPIQPSELEAAVERALAKRDEREAVYRQASGAAVAKGMIMGLSTVIIALVVFIIYAVFVG